MIPQNSHSEMPVRHEPARINSIDFARGLVMIIMALDHVRDMMHVNSLTQSPTNLATTTPMLFFTRWITYLCAPVFVFLAGTSAYLSFKRKNNLSQSRQFLFKRGAWLIILEFTLVNFGLFFDWKFSTFIFEVIAAIGFGFILLGLLLRSSLKVIGITGLLIICVHNLFPLLPFGNDSIFKAILTPLFTLTVYPLSSHTNLIIAYPPIPWAGIMLTGFAAGRLFEMTSAKRKAFFVRIGCVALVLFVVVRLTNYYGDPLPWSAQKNNVYTFLSFINVTKYPPSFLFCLLMLGIMFLILAFSENMHNKFENMVKVYGKVPLFYFLVHFYLVHLILIGILFLQGFHWSQMNFISGSFGRPAGVASGVNLNMVYLIWIAVVIVLYKPCVWFGKYKASHTNTWLKYM